MKDSGLALLPNHAMRARRCRGAIALVWAYEACFGAAIAWPFVAVVREAYGTHPRGDAVLWEPGGLPLLDLLVHRLPSLGPLVAHTVALVLLALGAGLVPWAALLVSVCFGTPRARAPSLRATLPRAIASLGPFGLLLAFSLALQASLVAAVAVVATLADQGFAPKYGESAADAIALACVGLGLGLVAMTGVLQDAARAAVVRFGVGAAPAIRAALGAVGRAPLRLLWSWTWRSLASVVPVAFGGVLASKIGGRHGAALVCLFVVHQLAVVVRVALRASWLAKAMRWMDAHGKDSLGPWLAPASER